MIFGDLEPPENWRENPEFCLYLSEIGGYSADRISGETDRVAGDLATLQQQTQDLAIDNYKTFITTSNCTAEIYAEFSQAETHLAGVLDKLGQFKADCAQFQLASQDISKHRRLTSLTLSKNTTLLEILELPQLMETVVRNQHYEEALQLHNYVTDAPAVDRPAPLSHPAAPVSQDHLLPPQDGRLQGDGVEAEVPAGQRGLADLSSGGGAQGRPPHPSHQDHGAT